MLVELGGRSVFVDLGVKVRLGERRLVAFVVPETPIGIHVDDNVAAKLLAKIERELAHLHAGERIVAVYMEDRHLDHFSDVGGVHR